MKNHYETTIDQWPTSWLLSWRCWYDDMTFISTRFTIWGLLIVVLNKFKSKGTRNKIIELNIIDLSGTISSIGKLNIDKLMPKLMDELYFSDVHQLPVIRSEQVKTFFYSTESQETKSEVLSISDLSCSAFPELVIA